MTFESFVAFQSDMALMFLGKYGLLFFQLCLVVYLFGDLAIYSTVVPKSLMSLIWWESECIPFGFISEIPTFPDNLSVPWYVRGAVLVGPHTRLTPLPRKNQRRPASRTVQKYFQFCSSTYSGPNNTCSFNTTIDLESPCLSDGPKYLTRYALYRLIVVLIVDNFALKRFLKSVMSNDQYCVQLPQEVDPLICICVISSVHEIMTKWHLNFAAPSTLQTRLIPYLYSAED